MRPASIAALVVPTALAAFDVAWNSPFPMQCGGIDAPDFGQWNVRANGPNATFNGDVVWTIYCPTSFSQFPHFDEENRPINGGIPQRGNLSLHLDTVRQDVERLFPDEAFAGYAVVDWEVWYPWLILASKSIWVNESLAYVKELHPDWSEEDVEAEAVRSWNETSKEFMAETLKVCVELRPKAKWGYYGRPGCYTGLDVTQDPPQCTDAVKARNDDLADLWTAGTALYPSVYPRPRRSLPPNRRDAAAPRSPVGANRRDGLPAP